MKVRQRNTGKHLHVFRSDSRERARNSAALTAADIAHVVFIELQLKQDAEKQHIQ